jgi:hypothetical protein
MSFNLANHARGNGLTVLRTIPHGHNNRGVMAVVVQTLDGPVCCGQSYQLDELARRYGLWPQPEPDAVADSPPVTAWSSGSPVE